jgi:sugar lactone lactonase YvrE
LKVNLGDESADILSISPNFLIVRIPEARAEQLTITGEGVELHAPLTVGTTFAQDLHPVSNPVVDSLGNVYVTLSGTRGEAVPFGVFVVHPNGNKQPFLGDITNPTALAIGPDDCLYVSSRHSGTVYRSTFDKQVEKYADGLGIASGMAFDSQGNLFVGDRSGTIYRVNPRGEASRFCELEPSISAYHLTVDNQDVLYVTGPTLATQDVVYRITPDAQVEVFFKGFGRPQGLTFDFQGRLHVTGSYRGRKGVYAFLNGEPQLTVAGPMLVGLAYDPSGQFLYLVDNQRLYRIGS